MPNHQKPFLRPVSDLLAEEAFDVRHEPSCMAVFSALDRLLVNAEDQDGSVDVPMTKFAAEVGDFSGVFFAMSMLRPGLAVICGKSPEGTLFEGDALLDEAARREAAGQPALFVFYRVQTSQLALDSSLAAIAA
jgi:hypothetical protein